MAVLTATAYTLLWFVSSKPCRLPLPWFAPSMPLSTKERTARLISSSPSSPRRFPTKQQKKLSINSIRSTFGTIFSPFFGVDSMGIEICASSVTHFGSDLEIPGQALSFDQTYGQPMLGMGISPAGDSSQMGSLGFYLKVEYPDHVEVLALTCHHVVAPGEEAPVRPEDPPIKIDSPSQADHDAWVAELARAFYNSADIHDFFSSKVNYNAPTVGRSDELRLGTARRFSPHIGSRYDPRDAAVRGIVFKQGRITGSTTGIANDCLASVQDFHHGKAVHSIELVITPCSPIQHFAWHGDSGAPVYGAHGDGQFMIWGGLDKLECERDGIVLDHVVFATPIQVILHHVEAKLRQSLGHTNFKVTLA
ncbi:hypothetical protein B0H67DRAFT_611756 [Lasiosphaeris hirsuta]|uniref:Uncharacterized protein n=1 Tax=Lasiosphaeris hirsuta TaxID=260670 RepID=A0AA40A9G3_9PEZI|nr:hypothetical protein B0H67DRAFT_611756 [Lasiosphaeris hirsuta]